MNLSLESLEQRGGVGRGGEGANKVLQPAQSVRLRPSKIDSYSY